MTVNDTDGEPPAPSQQGWSGGPAWRRTTTDGAAPTPPPSTLPPTAFTSAPAGRYVGDTGAHGAAAGSSDQLFTARYSRNGITPVPFAIVAVAAMGAAWWAMDRAQERGAPGERVTSEWWINVTAVLLPGESIRLFAANSARMWTALVLLGFAALAIAVWIGRIGSNLRSGDGPFGSLLPIVAFPAWFVLPITLGLTSNDVRSRSDVLIRTLLALALVLAQFVLLRWPVLNRIWRAGHLPYDMASIVLWLPMMVPWLMLYGSASFAIMTTDDGERITDAAWYPVESMEDWARWLTRASGVGLLVLLVVVTVCQHIGIARDRAVDVAARAR